MKMPGFNAESSCYQSGFHYNLGVVQSNADGGRGIRPQRMRLEVEIEGPIEAGGGAGRPYPIACWYTDFPGLGPAIACSV
jgi:hypothetical protein